MSMTSLPSRPPPKPFRKGRPACAQDCRPAGPGYGPLSPRRLPLTVGRESSIQLIESLGEERAIVVVAQLDPRLDSPKPADLHAVGTLATVHKVVRMPNQSRFVFTEGVERVRLVRYAQTEPFMVAEVEVLEDVEPEATASVEALVRNVIGQFQQIVNESQTLSDELRTIAANIEEPSRLVDFVASSLPFLTTDDKQQLLETPASQPGWSC
jgi:ATP-dependent Lon protease